MIYCDSHIHLSNSQPPLFAGNERYFCVTSCHSKEDLDFFKGASAAGFGYAQPPRRSGVPPFANAHWGCHSELSSVVIEPVEMTSLVANGGFDKLNHQNFFFIDTPNFGASYPCAFVSFGIHPQIVNPAYLKNAFPSDLALLESLCKNKEIVAIGECGFDFFTPEYKSTAAEQEIAFRAQLALAQKYNLPLVLHLRKSIEKIFTFSRELKKIPAVIFHSFPGTLREAVSLQNHGLNAFFSFGKPILNGKKSALDCVQNLPIQNLLFETDAPYQTLKGESETLPSDIKKVYEKASELRKISKDELCEKIFENFNRAFALGIVAPP